MAKRDRKSNTRAGYSLVEVTLALLVVAIGLTATFALFPEGLKASRASVDDSEIAMFAEYVFTTLDLTAGKEGGNYGSSGWGIADTDQFISLMLSRNVSDDNFRLQTGGVQTFYWYPDYYGLSSGDYASGNFQQFWTSAFTYTLKLEASAWKGYDKSVGVTAFAVLKVWPGEFADGVTPEGEPRVFYREVLPLR